LRPAGPLNTGANGEARPGPLVPSGTVPAPELVVMAAGLGSRFGGLKQLEPVGPSGEALLDYAVFDAVRAGVERVIFVIRREMDKYAKVVKVAGHTKVTRVDGGQGLCYRPTRCLPSSFPAV